MFLLALEGWRACGHVLRGENLAAGQGNISTKAWKSGSMRCSQDLRGREQQEAAESPKEGSAHERS